MEAWWGEGGGVVSVFDWEGQLPADATGIAKGNHGPWEREKSTFVFI